MAPTFCCMCGGWGWNSRLRGFAMNRLHLIALGCVSAIATTHTLECQHDPNTTVVEWVGAIAYCVLAIIQLILFFRGGNDPHRPPSL